MKRHLVAVLLAAVCFSPAIQAAEWPAPTVVAPSASHAEPPAAALPVHAKRIGAVAFDMDALHPSSDVRSTRNAARNEPAWLAPRLHLQLFADVGFEATGLRIEQDDFGNSTWVGAIDGVEDGIVLLTTNGSQVVGRVDYGLDQYQLIGDTRSGVWVTELDPTSYAGMVDAETQRSATSADLASLAAPRQTATMGVTAGHTIDVLVLYSAKALQQMDTGPLPGNPAPFVANLVADANQSFLNRSVNGAVRVVGYKLIPGYTEPILSGDSTVCALSAFCEFLEVRNSMWGPSHHPNPYLSIFSGVPSLRDQYHADVVAMFVDGTRITNGPCGVSILMTSASGNPDDVYQVLSTACAIGDRTFTHELGHILAGRHDNNIPDNSPPNPFLTDYGYSTDSPLSFHTIMGSLTDGTGGPCNPSVGCPRINRWSSTSQTWMGAPLGTTVPVAGTTYSTNMVTTLGTTDPIVAAYRTPTGLTLPGTPGTPQHHDCQNMTHISWSGASGTVGWYESQFDSNSSFPSPFGGYKGPGTWFSTHLISSQWFRVRACNAAGCGGWASTQIPATGPTCDPI